MAVHELGHLLGAIVTGGTVERVVLHPFAISRTDVQPNPNPAAVVWAGPIVGIVLPLLILVGIPRGRLVACNVARFFAGFCCVANGAYIAFGSVHHVGDCGEMFKTGTPLWLMIAFGSASMSVGLYLWHRMGSLYRYFSDTNPITAKTAGAAFGLLIVVGSVLLILAN